MSFFGHFRTEILFVSKRWPFFEAKIRNYLDNPKQTAQPVEALGRNKKDANGKNMQR